MDIIKKHWLKIGIGIIVLIVMVLAALAVKNLVFPNDSLSLYGNRLEGIEDVQISDKRFKELTDKLKGNDKVVSVSHDISGRIINFIIDVKKDTDLITAKSLGDEIIKAFNEKELAFYDLQLFLTCSEDKESELYPTIGYKHKTSVSFKWNTNQ